MARAIGYRLESGLAHDLTWLLTQAAQVVSGLAAQCYATSSAGTLPERLLLQERNVEYSSANIRREAKLLAAARRLVESGPDGAWHWTALKLAYGPMRRGDPHEEFGREQGAVARHSGAVLERAAEEWAEWYCRNRAGQAAERALRAWNGSRSEGDWERLCRALPAAPSRDDLESIVQSVLDGLCARLRASRSMGTPDRAEDSRLAREVHAQTDALLAAASEAFAKAYYEVLREDHSAAERKREADEEAARESRRESRELAERVLRSLRGEAA